MIRGPKPSPKLPRFLTAALAGLLLAGGAAQARTVKIITADSLELRNVDNQEIVIISGQNVELRIDDDWVKAERVEFNRTKRTLTLIGRATYHTAKDGQNLTGDDLVVDMGSEALTGQDVLISDSTLQIRGAEIERVPGQLRATSSYFTPCARCGRTTNDYAFTAERLVVYPGDRLIAYRAKLLLADHPVLYLPVLVLPLNDQSRQPKLSIGKDPQDGYTVSADLPFSIGSSVLGTTLLRYYQNREPRFGGGTDLHAYAPYSWIDRLDLYGLALPKPILRDGTKQPGYDIDLNFSVKGRFHPSLATSDLTYSLKVFRKDIGRDSTSTDYGLTAFDFAAQVEYPKFTAALYYLDRFGPDPATALPTPLKHPEVNLNPKPFSVGDINMDFDFTAGDYTAASNPNSRQAREAGLNFTTTRLEEKHNISYTKAPNKDTEIQLTNTFIGHYYGTGARTVQLNMAAQLTRRWGTGNSFSVRQEYIRYEGTSPFAFDAVTYNLSAPLTIAVNTVPLPGSRFGVTYQRDAFIARRTTIRNEHLKVTAGVNRAPVNFDYSLDYNWALGELDSSAFNLTVGDPNSNLLTLMPETPAVAATPTTPAQAAVPAYYRRSSAWPFPKVTFGLAGSYSRPSGGLQPVSARMTYTDDIRVNTFSVTGIYDLMPLDPERPLKSLGVTYSAVPTGDSVLNPYTLTGSETLALQYPRITGTHSLTWRGYTLSTSHDLALEQPVGVTESGNVTFSVGTVSGKAANWQMTYGGPYDLQRQGFTRPTLSGTFSLTQPGQKLNVSAAMNFPGLDQQRRELTQASVDAAWQKGRFSLSGRANYLRSRSGIYPDDIANDTLTFDPLRVGLALGSGPKPGAYLTASLRQTLRYTNGVRSNPEDTFAPVIGLTIDRCCWVLQGEVDMSLRRYRLSIGLPGQMYPLFQLDENSASVPLLPLNNP